MKTGHPCRTLSSQKGTAKVHFEPAIVLFYDMQITTDAASSELGLTEAEGTLMARIAGNGTDFKLDLLGAQKRMLYVTITGANMRFTKSFHSHANLEHLYFVLSTLPLIWEVYGDQVKNNVAIFTPYAAQRNQYLSAFTELRNQGSKDGDGWKDGDLPTVLTVD